MAAATVTIDPHHQLVSGVSPLSASSAAELSRVMSENHSKHHVFFNDMGFHNHVGHHLVTLYALGASPAEIAHAFQHNAQYQRPSLPEHAGAQSKLSDVAAFTAALGDSKQYSDFLTFFTAEVSRLGTSAVLNEYIFKGDERAELMYTRLFSSILHPLIHLGLALEFGIAAMLAEALAWTAVHGDETGDYVRTTAAKAEAAGTAKLAPADLPSLIALYREENRSPAIHTGAKGPGDNIFTRMGPLTKNHEAVSAIAARYAVPVDQLHARTAEAVNAIAYLTISQQRPPYTPKVDFFGVHMLNATVFLPALNKILTPEQAARVLQDLVRVTFLLNAMNDAPDMDAEYFLSFERDPARRAKQYKGTEYPTWESIYTAANKLDDDGHVAKAIRALKGAELLAGSQSTWEEPIAKEDIRKAAAVLMRSCESEPDFVIKKGPTDMWTRGGGFEEAWKPFAKIE